MKLDNWLAQRSLSCPERPALLAEGAEMTYAELEAEATWVARRLTAHGVRRGSTAALTMHPRREQVVLVHALMKAGAREVSAYITHAVLSDGAAARIAASKLKELVVTDSIGETDGVLAAGNIRRISIAPLIGEAIARTASEQSVSSLFD